MKKLLISLTMSLSILTVAFGQSKPTKVTADGYDSHIELKWDSSEKEGTKFNVYASFDGGNEFVHRGTTDEHWYMDFVNDQGRNITVQYKITAVTEKGKESKPTDMISASIRDFSDEELMEMVQQYTFRYFWDFAHPTTGMSRERDAHKLGDKVVTVGGSGFGVMAIIVGAERGWITREQAVDHLLKVTKFLEETDRFHGMWAHWYDGDAKKVVEFGHKDNGGDIVESSFMAQGLLTARQYFDGNGKKEQQLRERITKLWEDMEWDFYTNGQEYLIWHWSPDHGFEKNHGIRGYNECFITYILAGSSPSHSIPTEAYHKSWAGWDNPNFANYETYFDMILPLGSKRWYGGPLFFAHYSYLGLDPRGLSDMYANYWEQNKAHTLINRQYCINNPYGYEGYGENFWGLTAGDKVPTGYNAFCPGYVRDGGNVQPTAALSSMPYTPEESMGVLKNFYRNYGRELFGPMGFYDGINLNVEGPLKNQVRKTYIAIDQGPILVMIENHRSGLLWENFMKNTDVLKGLKKLNFKINNREIQVK
ncbi:glucoamylase family protein [Limibacter armeniacum]|uniref:glucoamylase family protein n=1 Tax=Limibacter armeniacum TaxID=466084 RepID=UPI002FE66651